MAEYKRKGTLDYYVKFRLYFPVCSGGLQFNGWISVRNYKTYGKTVFQFISNILRYVPIATAIAWIVYYYICMKFLKGEGEFLYDKVKFVFYDNSVLENIKVENISQNKSWITAKNQENTEYRFRVKDIKTIEYSNTENQIECEQE